MNKTYFSAMCLGIMILNAFFSAFSQILLKKSTMVIYRNSLQEYINWRVILAYSLYIIILLTNAFAYKGIAYKFGSIIGVSSYIFLMLLSYFVLKEKIIKKTLIGNCIIIIGILIYSSKLF